MYFNLSGKPLPVGSWPNENLWKLQRTSTFQLNKSILLYDVRHFLLLLLALVDFFLEFCNLLGQMIKAMTICRAIRYGTYEGSVRIFKRL